MGQFLKSRDFPASDPGSRATRASRYASHLDIYGTRYLSVFSPQRSARLLQGVRKGPQGPLAA